MIGTATLSREHADIVIVAVITIMRVTSAAIYEIYSTFNMMLRRISSTDQTSVVTRKELLHSPVTTTEIRCMSNRENKPRTEGHIDQP